MLAGTRPRARVWVFAAPVALAGLAIGLLNWHWYGSPLRSGYGAAGEIYALANVWPNAKAYGSWTIETQPVLMLAPLALFVLRGRLTLWLCFFALLVAVAYLAYGVFDVWSYLRLLLPAIAVGAALVGGLGARAVGAVPGAWRAPAWLALALAIVAQGLIGGRSHGVTMISDEHRRMALAGPYLAAALPRDAVIIAGEQSGAVRYYTGRAILRWESIEPLGLSEIIFRLASGGHDLWWVLDRWEEPLVRARFPGLAAAALDWPPVLDAGPLMTTRAWRLADRERFLRGERVLSDRLR
jgi:hypothetical protein